METTDNTEDSDHVTYNYGHLVPLPQRSLTAVRLQTVSFISVMNIPPHPSPSSAIEGLSAAPPATTGAEGPETSTADALYQAAGSCTIDWIRFLAGYRIA